MKITSAFGAFLDPVADKIMCGGPASVAAGAGGDLGRAGQHRCRPLDRPARCHVALLAVVTVAPPPHPSPRQGVHRAGAAGHRASRPHLHHRHGGPCVPNDWQVRRAAGGLQLQERWAGGASSLRCLVRLDAAARAAIGGCFPRKFSMLLPCCRTRREITMSALREWAAASGGGAHKAVKVGSPPQQPCLWGLLCVGRLAAVILLFLLLAFCCLVAALPACWLPLAGQLAGQVEDGAAGAPAQADAFIACCLRRCMLCLPRLPRPMHHGYRLCGPGPHRGCRLPAADGGYVGAAAAA